MVHRYSEGLIRSLWTTEDAGRYVGVQKASGVSVGIGKGSDRV